MERILFFDITAIFITLIFIVTGLVRKNAFGNRRNYLIFWIEIMVLVATIGDLGSAVIEQYFHSESWARTASYVFNYLYFLAHNMVQPLYLFFVYASMGLWHKFEEKKYLIYIWTFLTGLDILLLALNFLVKIIFTVDESGYYHRGPLHIIFYLVAVAMAIWGITLIIGNRKLIGKDKMLVLLLIYPMVFTTIVIQYFYPDTLCEMFGICICLLVFVIVIQHKETTLDPLVGAKRHSAGLETLTNIIDTGKPSTILLIKIVNNGNILMYLGQEVYHRLLVMLSNQFCVFAKEENYRADLYYLEYGLYGLLSEEDALTFSYKTAEKIRDYLNEELVLDDFSISVDARICIVQCPDDFTEFQSLFNFATGFQNTIPPSKNVILYSDYKSQTEFRIRDELDTIMSNAIKNHGFEMYYQPIYSTRKNRFICAEALIRLKDDTYGYISPSLFIPLAEKNGMIHEIGDFILEEVLSFIENTDMDALGLEYIEINLSASQCIESDLIDKVTRLLDEHKVLPSQISFELTETAADMDPAIVDSHVTRLSNLGVRFALDDYGTGYSNIKRVTSLPINQVKLDQSFVSELDNPQMWIVIQDTITMLKEMDKEVLIEGVENEELAKRFIDLNCDLIQGCEYMQGYYFCKPIPKDQFIQFMQEHVNMDSFKI